jgi:hypothetical protein
LVAKLGRFFYIIKGFKKRASSTWTSTSKFEILQNTWKKNQKRIS